MGGALTRGRNFKTWRGKPEGKRPATTTGTKEARAIAIANVERRKRRGESQYLKNEKVGPKVVTHTSGLDY